MQDVFATALTEVQHPGRLFCREVRDWPGSVLQEHLRARKRKMPSNGSIDERPLPRSELLAAMIIFLLPLLSIFVPLFSIFFAITDISLPQWMDYSLLILLWGAVLFGVLFGLGLAMIKGLPRWSLSYLGFVLMLGIILSRTDRIWSWLYPYFIQSFGPRSYWSLPIRIIYVGIFEFILSFSILLSAWILVNLLRLLPYTRRVWQRIRADWTQLSFMLFGGLVLGIQLADWTQLSFMLFGGLVLGIQLVFDEYRHEDIWKFMAWTCLALGAWLYLRAKGQKQRILTLIGGATGAMWIVALAKWLLIPLQEWPTGYPVAPSEATRWVETSGALIAGVCYLIILLAPALLNLLPHTPSPILSKEEDPVIA
jgi:hypothetical protein